MKQIVLKPCPFCGGRHGRVRRIHDGYRIVCPDCGASSHYVFIQKWHDSKDVAQCQAAKAWNSRKAPPNNPLTLDELRAMDGQPLWIVGVSCINNFKGHWDICDWENDGRIAFPYCMEEPDLDTYGTDWFAYRHKPEAML